MQGKRLLERLRAIDQHPDWRGDSDPKAAIASVIDHLIKILNTRQGSAPTANDLGMPDFTSIAGSLNADSLPEMAQIITQVITKYEPRLTQVHVDFETHQDKAFMVAFKLSAKIRLEDRELPVVFETVLNSDGQITIME